MATARVTIENKIVDILENAASLTEINRIFRGIPYSMKTDYMPCIEVAVATRNIITRTMGNNALANYEVGLRISVFKQDLVNTTNRTFIMQGHERVGDLADLVQAVLESDANVNLQSLTFDNGSVCGVEFISPQEYGIGELVADDSFNQNKVSNLFNFAFLPLIVRTEEDL